MADFDYSNTLKRVNDLKQELKDAEFILNNKDDYAFESERPVGGDKYDVYVQNLQKKFQDVLDKIKDGDKNAVKTKKYKKLKEKINEHLTKTYEAMCSYDNN